MTITTASDRLEVVDEPVVDVRPLAPADTPGDPGELGAAEAPASTRPTFTITDAATACSVSRKTITRKLPELAGHGAAKDDDGVWRIPVEALLAVGLHPGRSLPALPSADARPLVAAPAPPRPVVQDTVTIPRDRWDDVRIRLARAEAEAAERGLALADARLALRALTAGPVASGRPAEGSTGRPAPSGVPVATPLASWGAAHPGVIASAAPGQHVAEPGQGSPSGPAPTAAPGAPGAPSTEAESAAPTEDADAVPADIVAARNLAARTGGYVPAGATPAKKRRWWQSR